MLGAGTYDSVAIAPFIVQNQAGSTNVITMDNTGDISANGLASFGGSITSTIGIYDGGGSTVVSALSTATSLTNSGASSGLLRPNNNTLGGSELFLIDPNGGAQLIGTSQSQESWLFCHIRGWDLACNALCRRCAENNLLDHLRLEGGQNETRNFRFTRIRLELRAGTSDQAHNHQPTDRDSDSGHAIQLPDHGERNSDSVRSSKPAGRPFLQCDLRSRLRHADNRGNVQRDLGCEPHNRAIRRRADGPHNQPGQRIRASSSASSSRRHSVRRIRTRLAERSSMAGADAHRHANFSSGLSSLRRGIEFFDSHAAHADDATVTSYVDKSIAASTTYNYYVVSVDSAGTQSPPSNNLLVQAAAAPSVPTPPTPLNLTGTVIN